MGPKKPEKVYSCCLRSAVLQATVALQYPSRWLSVLCAAQPFPQGRPHDS